jgi:hypothetical protein
MKPTLVVMAAGMASRYGGLQQTEPVGSSGELIIEYSIFGALRAGFGKVVLVIRRDIEKAFRAVIGDALADRIIIDYAWQELDRLPGVLSPCSRLKTMGHGTGRTRLRIGRWRAVRDC